MAKRPIFTGHSILATAALQWYERTPKWKLAIMLEHLAAKASGTYDDALLSGQWFDGECGLLEEEVALERAGCFQSQW